LPVGAFLKNFNCPEPRLWLTIVYLSEVENLPLDDPSTCCPAVLRRTPIPFLLLTILLPIGASQKHRTRRIPSSDNPEKGQVFTTDSFGVNWVLNSLKLHECDFEIGDFEG
jgi:hypothetical protein